MTNFHKIHHRERLEFVFRMMEQHFDVAKLLDPEDVHTLGMISHKMSLITIFGHKHEIKNFIKKFDTFHEKFLILMQKYFKID